MRVAILGIRGIGTPIKDGDRGIDGVSQRLPLDAIGKRGPISRNPAISMISFNKPPNWWVTRPVGSDWENHWPVMFRRFTAGTAGFATSPG